MIIGWWEHSEKRVTRGQTDRRTEPSIELLGGTPIHGCIRPFAIFAANWLVYHINGRVVCYMAKFLTFKWQSPICTGPNLITAMSVHMYWQLAFRDLQSANWVIRDQFKILHYCSRYIFHHQCLAHSWFLKTRLKLIYMTIHKTVINCDGIIRCINPLLTELF